jgi:ABC-2 type transport system ATP-binding protein
VTIACLQDKVTDALGAQAPARPVSVAVENLTKGFGVRRSVLEAIRHPFATRRTVVVNEITFEIRQREIFGILGLNGAGKTTLLKMLATLLVPDAGRVEIQGVDAVAEPRHVRQILALVSAEERSLNWRLSATENLKLFAGLHRLRAPEAASRIDDALRTVGLSEAGEKLVGHFSSGMRQRLLLARALISRPKILLMDEPTRSLDPVTAHAFRLMLREEIVNRGGATVLIATHNPEESFTFCDRVAVVHRGRVAAMGRGPDLAARFGQNRYRIWTPMQDHPVFDVLVRRGLVSGVARQVDDGGNASVECVVEGDEGSAAEVLRRLVEARVVVSRFERAPMSLSSLIAQIVEQHEIEEGVTDA